MIHRIGENDNWADEVACLTEDDLLNLDPAMMIEADRRATRLLIEDKIKLAAQTDLFVYASLRYGFHCPEPDRAVHDLQAMVIDDLMSLDDPGSDKGYVLTAPRGFVKTSTVSDWLEWKLGNQPWLRSKLVAAAERGSIQQLGLLRKNIMLDPLFRAIFPGTRVDGNRANNKTNLSLIVPDTVVDTRNATIEAWGIGSSPERGRAEILWFDDISTYTNSIKEPKERENIREKLKVTWFPLRSGPNTISIVTFTPFHEQDASMSIFKSKEGWKKRFMKISSDFSHLEEKVSGTEIKLPENIWNPTTREFETWWNAEELEKLYRRDPEEFRVAYWMETVDSESDSPGWKSTWLYGDPETGTEGAVRYGFDANHQLYKCPLITIGVDLAFGRSGWAKNTAITVTGLREDGMKIILDSKYGHGWGTSRKVEEIVRMSRKWSPDIIVVEDNAAQSMLVDLLTDNNMTGARIMPFTTNLYKDAKLRVLSGEFEDGWWICPFKDEVKHSMASSCRCGRCQLLTEMISYPNYDTSDSMMSLLFAREGLKELASSHKKLEMFDLSL